MEFTKETVENLRKAKQLMLEHGRARFVSRDRNGYCPLGAIAEARSEYFLTESMSLEATVYQATPMSFEAKVYQATPEAEAVAHSIESAYPQITQILNGHKEYSAVTVVHGWNDETEDDSKVFKVMDDAIMWARIRAGATLGPARGSGVL